MLSFYIFGNLIIEIVHLIVCLAFHRCKHNWALRHLFKISCVCGKLGKVFVSVIGGVGQGVEGNRFTQPPTRHIGRQFGSQMFLGHQKFSTHRFWAYSWIWIWIIPNLLLYFIDLSLYGNFIHAHPFKIFLNMCYCSDKDFLSYSYEVLTYNAVFDKTFYAKCPLD